MHARHWLFRSLIALSLLINLLAGTAAPAARAEGAAVQAAGDELWDNRFGLPGVEGGEVTSIAIAANGDIYLAGRFTEAGNVKANLVARWDGRQFHALGEGLTGGGNVVYGIAAAGNDLYAVGSFTSAGAVSANGIAHWNGTEWLPVGTGEGAKSKDGGDFGAWLRTAAIHDGRLIIAGAFETVDGVRAKNIAAWDGTSWGPLGGGLLGPETWSNAEVRTLLSTGDKLYAGGNFELADGVFGTDPDGNPVLIEAVTVNSLAVWDGAVWSPVGSGMQLNAEGRTELGTVMALAYGNNTLYAGGYFNRAGGTTVNYVAQYAGGQWRALGSGVRPKDFASDSPIAALAFQDGLLYVGGDFTAAGGKALPVLATWDGTNWGTRGGGIPNANFEKVHALAAGADTVVVGGSFRLAGGKRVENITRLAGGEFQPLGQGIGTDWSDMPGETYALVADGDGNVYAGGFFERAGGIAARNLARFDGSRWHNIGNADKYVAALAVGDGFLYAGGDFTEIGGIAASHIARMDLQTGVWSALGSGINDTVNALAYSDGILYAGGAFKSAGSATAEDLAWWDGTTWHAFGTQARIFEVGDRGSEVGTFVKALAVAGDDVYIGGHFQTVQFGTNTQDLSSFRVVHNVVRWNRAADRWGYVGTAAQPGVTSNGFSGFGTDVYDLALVGNSLFIGGKFNQAGGTAATGGLARYDLAAGQWVSIDGSLGGLQENFVKALAPSGADLLVAGAFTSAGAAPARYIARFDTTTNQWVTLGSGLRWYNDRFTEAQAVLALPSGVYVAGKFDQAGGKGSLGFARWGGALAAPNLTPGAGGTVGANGVTATFPAGAVGEDSVATLGVAPQPAFALPDGWGGLYGVLAGATTVSGRQLGQVAQPYAVRAPYTDAQLAAAGVQDAGTLQLVVWDGAAWQPLPSVVDVQNKVVTAATQLLRPLALVGAKQVGGGGQEPNVTPGEGGTVGANGVTATFPPGAVGENTVAALAVAAQLVQPAPGGWAGLYGMDVSAKTVNGTQLGQTAKPFTVAAPYTDAQLAAAGIADASSLQLLVWTGGGWQALPSTVNVGAKTVTGATDQLKPLALVGKLAGGQVSEEKLYLPALSR